MTNTHRIRNCLAKIKGNGLWIFQENGINEVVAQASNNLLFDLGDWRPCVNGMSFEALDKQEAEGLKLSFEEEEVFSVFLDLNEDKTPSLDGFSMAFQ